jgi:hypothetical protein
VSYGTGGATPQAYCGSAAIQPTRVT